MYAIVDIETTGSYAAGHKITEIAICITDGVTVTDRYVTLVNPERPIPYFIQRLTGITDEMATKAPLFSEVAATIYQLLCTQVFVAHNVNFDYSFICGMLEEEGYTLKSKKLCTVSLSRKLVPGLPSYKLSSLCSSLSINHTERHRAEGDCVATADLFIRLLSADKDGIILKSLKDRLSRYPPNVSADDFAKLPSSPGVYYFRDRKGVALYVGKAKNLKARVNSHFSSGFKSRQKQRFLAEIYSISFERCGTELIASLFEDHEIRQLWPKMNQAQKNRQLKFGLYRFEDQNGYYRLIADRAKLAVPTPHVFFSHADAVTFLRQLISKHNLCPKLCFLSTECRLENDQFCCKGACTLHESAEVYNARVRAAMDSASSGPNVILLGEGKKEGNLSFILMEQGKVLGIGYIAEPAEQTSLNQQVRSNLIPLSESGYTRGLVLKHISSNTYRTIYY